MPYGITSDCVDDQGSAFSLGQLPDPSDRPASEASLFQMSSTFLVRWRAST